MYGPCRGSSVTCVDCLKTFHNFDFEAHTSCLSEAEKYEGKLYKGPKKNQNQPKPSPSPVSSIISSPTPSPSPSTVGAMEKEEKKTSEQKSSSSSDEKEDTSKKEKDLDEEKWKPVVSAVDFDWKVETLKIISKNPNMKQGDVEDALRKSFISKLKKQSKPYLKYISSKKVKKYMKKK